MEATQRAYVEACQHIKFMASLYREQIDGGRYFLHDHQRSASSWALPCMQDLERRPGVSTVPADQYQYGFIMPTGPDTGRLAKKPTDFMSNSPEILRSLGRRCHAKAATFSVLGSTSKAMAKHPRELRRAMLRGLTHQLRVDGRLQPGCYGIQSQDDDCIREIYGPAQGYSGKYKDDLTGQVLKDSLVMEARKK